MESVVVYYFNAYASKSDSSINIKGRISAPNKQQCFHALAGSHPLCSDQWRCNCYSKPSHKYPISAEIIRTTWGAEKQIKNIGSSAHFAFGGHTHHHPYLTQLSPEKQQEEIIENKRLLEQIGRKPVRYFAYPGGKYSLPIIDIVKACGFSAACAEKSLNLGEPRFELPRTGIYSPSLIKFILKLMRVP